MQPIRGSRYPIWSARAIALISIPVVVSITVLVFWISYSPAYVELQITLQVIAAVLFAFLTLGLYRGVRLKRPHREPLSFTPLSQSAGASGAQPSRGDLLEFAARFMAEMRPPHIDLDVGDAAGGADDLLGCLVSIVVWIVASIVLAFLLWLLAQVLWATLFVLIAALYWLFYRALRIVFARSRLCQGRLLLSLRYALVYTMLYTGWMFGLLWLGRFALPR